MGVIDEDIDRFFDEAELEGRGAEGVENLSRHLGLERLREVPDEVIHLRLVGNHAGMPFRHSP